MPTGGPISPPISPVGCVRRPPERDPSPGWDNSRAALLGLGFVEIVQVDPLDLDGPGDPNADIEADHQPRQLGPVDEHEPERAGLAGRRQRLPGKRRGGDQDALLRPLPDQRAYERLHGLAADRVAGLVALRLQVHAVEAELVLADHAVDATVPGAAEMLAGVGARAAVAHGQQQVDDEPLEEGGRRLEDSGKERIPQGFIQRQGRRGNLLVGRAGGRRRQRGTDSRGRHPVLAFGSGQEACELRKRLEKRIVDPLRIPGQHGAPRLADLDEAAFGLLDEACLLQVRLGPVHATCDDRSSTARDLLGALVFGECQIVCEARDEVSHRPCALRSEAEHGQHQRVVCRDGHGYFVPPSKRVVQPTPWRLPHNPPLLPSGQRWRRLLAGPGRRAQARSRGPSKWRAGQSAQCAVHVLIWAACDRPRVGRGPSGDPTGKGNVRPK